MNDVPDTELFSAYLDGELTAEEQIRVEQALAASPEARQLLEELRALGGTLQGLPQEKLDEDLSARVLEIAERRMLMPGEPGNKPSAGRAAEALTEPAADAIGWLGIPWREISWRGMLSRRALVWSGVVVATAIIISLTSPPAPKGNRDLAMRDKRPAAGAAVAEKRGKSSTSDGSWDVPAGQRRILREENTLAKDESRKDADAVAREAKTEAHGNLRNETDRRREGADALGRAGGKKVADKLADKESESPARRLSKAGSEELASELRLEKAKAEKSGENHLHAVEQPPPSDVAVHSASGGMPAASDAPGKPASGSVADGSVPKPTAGQSGELQQEKLAMRDGTEFRSKSAGRKWAERPVGEPAKEFPASGEVAHSSGARSQKKALPSEEMKVAPPREALAESNPAPAAAPMPAAPAPAVASQPGALKSDAGESAAASPPPAIAMSKSPAAAKAMEAPAPASAAKVGPGKAAVEGYDIANDRVAKDNGTTPLMNGTNSALVAGNSSVAGVTTATNWKGGQAAGNRFPGQTATVTTFVRLDVSSVAVQNKVFEGLVARLAQGNDQNFANMTQNAPVDNSSRRPSEVGKGGGSQGQDLNRQQNVVTNGGGMGGGIFQLAPSGSISSGSLNQQQFFSQPASPAAQNNVNREGNSQVPAAPASQGAIGSNTTGIHRDDAKGLQPQLTKALVYQFDASPEQLATIIKQIGERPDSFSAVEISAALPMNSFAQNYAYGANNYSGATTINGGTLTNTAGQQQRDKADTGLNVSRQETAQPQAAAPPALGTAKPTAAPAARAAKQHVVFVLNVVDRLPPAAGRASQLSAPAAPPPAKH